MTVRGTWWRRRVTRRRDSATAQRREDAAWDGDVTRLYSVHEGSPESRSLGVEGVLLLSISPQGEMALLLRPRILGGWMVSGTLARLPIGGAAPREMLENVGSADTLRLGDLLGSSFVVLTVLQPIDLSVDKRNHLSDRMVQILLESRGHRGFVVAELLQAGLHRGHENRNSTAAIHTGLQLTNQPREVSGSKRLHHVHGGMASGTTVIVSPSVGRAPYVRGTSARGQKEAELPSSHDVAVTGLAVSSKKGRYVFVGDARGTVSVVDASGELRLVQSISIPDATLVKRLELCRNGKHLLAVTNGQKICGFDVDDGHRAAVPLRRRVQLRRLRRVHRQRERRDGGAVGVHRRARRRRARPGARRWRWFIARSSN